MKKKILSVILALPLMAAAATTAFAKTNALEEAISKVSKKIANSQEIPQSAKLAFIDFRETATGQHMNMSFAIEDELGIALIREMPGRIMIRQENMQKSRTEEKNEIFYDLAHLQEFAKQSKANYIIGGNYHFDSENVIININVVNTENGIILFSERIKIRRADLSRKLQPGTIN
ncbi:MAG: hypothetical protein J5706_06140 [Elusimicrobiales bacterium]|nr:hypothetical protein [Elusimicrobiales bacterium]